MIKQDYARRPSMARRAFTNGLLLGSCLLAFYIVARFTLLLISNWDRVSLELRTNAGLQVAVLILSWGFALALMAVIADIYSRGRRPNGSR